MARRKPGSIELRCDDLSDAELGQVFLAACHLASGHLPSLPSGAMRLFASLARSVDAAMIQREDREREIWSALAWAEIQMLDESDGSLG